MAPSCPTLCDPMDYTVHGILIKGNPLQRSRLKNPMDRATVHGVAKSWTQLSDQFPSTPFCLWNPPSLGRKAMTLSDVSEKQFPLIDIELCHEQKSSALTSLLESRSLVFYSIVLSLIYSFM